MARHGGLSPSTEWSINRIESASQTCYARHVTNPKGIDGHPLLGDEAELIERVLDVSERDSVIEGLPEFSAEFKNKLREELITLWRQKSVPSK